MRIYADAPRAAAIQAPARDLSVSRAQVLHMSTLEDIWQQRQQNAHPAPPDSWSAFTERDVVYRNMGSLLASNLAHLAETAMMLTLVQQMVTDALETEDPDTRKEIQVRAESVLNMVDNSQAQQTTLVQLAIQQNAQQALYLNGNGNGYTNGYENGNGYTNGNGYANGYLESLAERFVPVDSTSLGIEVDLSAGREAISRQLSNIEAALTTVVAQRQGLQQNQGRLNHARASLSQNPGA